MNTATAASSTHFTLSQPVMNAEEYKRLINQKDVLDHTTLNVTLKEMVSRHEFDLAGQIKRVLENNMIAKPDLPSSPYDTSVTYYKVDLPLDSIKRIIDIFFDLEVSHVDKDGNTTPTASFYASLADKWTALT